MSQTRVEHDLLGTKEVPAEAYYGIHTVRAVENFPITATTMSDIPDFVRGMVMVKKAAALANLEMGVLDETVAKAIVGACDEILVDGRCMDQFPSCQFQGGAGTSVNMNTNEVVANLALERLGHPRGSYDIVSPNDDVNRSQSTNDAYPTGFRIALWHALERLEPAIVALREACYDKSEEFREVLKMGRTQLQDAVPMSMGQEFGGFAVTLDEELHVLGAAARMLLDVNLGATAIGTGVNTPPDYRRAVIKHLRAVTGLPVTGAMNLIEATSDTGDYVNVHAALKRSAVKVSKICNDLRLLSSGPRAGFNEINLPELQAGSSIMPAKVNPVIPEVVNQVCFKVIGNDVTVTMAAEAGQLQLNVMEPVIAQAMFESISLLTNAIETLTEKCVEGITANVEVARQNVMNSIGIVTYLNPIIGHHNGDRVGRECARSGRGVREVVLEMGLLSAAELDDILSPSNLLRPKYKGKADKRDVAQPGQDMTGPTA
ncbi:aspartate ammonia-lyase [Dietzia maris]|uniref:aspartate ammonia-lyase n=1 Tax=Dietzia maris TaxID=37915 RepID=UPI0037C6E682